MNQKNRNLENSCLLEDFSQTGLLNNFDPSDGGKNYDKHNNLLDEVFSISGLANNLFSQESTILNESDTTITLKPFKLTSNKETHDISNESTIPTKTTVNASAPSALAPSEDSGKLSNISIAEWLTSQFTMININDTLYVYDAYTGYYNTLNTNQKVDQFIRSSIPSESKPYITNYTNKEAQQWLLSMNALKVDADDLDHRKDYILFSDCVVDIKTGEVLDYDPELYFTSSINAHYLDDYEDGEIFETFLSTITQNNTQLYKRIQELFGYVISNIRNIKVIPYLIGPKDSGKSIVLKLLTYLLGENFTSEIGMEEFNDERYLNQLVGKKLNVCAEISEIPLKKLDILKKLSGGDSLLVRQLYHDAKKFHNEAALIFAGNDLPNIKRSQDRSRAFYDRLLLIPFQYQVPKRDQDINLLQKLFGEINYIARWALEGLQRLIKNNYCFTQLFNEAELIEQYKSKNLGMSINNFISSCCLIDPKLNIYTTDLYEAYEDYCFSINLVPESSKAFHATLMNQYKIQHKRLRQDTENRRAYIGVGLQDAELVTSLISSQTSEVNPNQMFVDNKPFETLNTDHEKHQTLSELIESFHSNRNKQQNDY